jgi:hypothetical protein
LETITSNERRRSTFDPKLFPSQTPPVLGDIERLKKEIRETNQENELFKMLNVPEVNPYERVNFNPDEVDLFNDAGVSSTADMKTVNQYK